MLSLIEFGIKAFFGWQKKKATTEVELKEIESKENIAVVNARAAVLKAGAFWFQVLFVVPLGFWWASILLYSVFWHKNGPWPHAGEFNPNWDIAALPPELMGWAAGIIAYLFLFKPGGR